MSSQAIPRETFQTLLHCALIAAAAIPVARAGGEPTVLVFCLIVAILRGLSRRRF
jgi:hypothetical protein